MKIKLSKEHIRRIVSAASLLVFAAAVAGICIAVQFRAEKKEASALEPEIKEYREMIGTSMDIKKAELVMFNTKEECADFIKKHGGAKAPSQLGMGIIPMMEESETGAYYNVVGNTILEQIYDSLKDGEYTKEPFEMSGMFCYLKRIGNYSPLTDEYISELIKKERKEE